ncbi:hypothetical protein T12_5193 [Trichinella patagoniensis]|uniref:Uncharacterized protein n=1 Tax=Trichinella patagoniensis TaxID=990121 RepID=A0A0V1A5C2_9BILA|nr:hypothetical protein T12_5193 [Trichinella patagoniensis]
MPTESCRLVRKGNTDHHHPKRRLDQKTQANGNVPSRFSCEWLPHLHGFTEGVGLYKLASYIADPHRRQVLAEMARLSFICFPVGHRTRRCNQKRGRLGERRFLYHTTPRERMTAS